jgi:hypothetical protein
MATKGDGEFQAMQARLADLLPRLNERDQRLAGRGCDQNTQAGHAVEWSVGVDSTVVRAHQPSGLGDNAPV